MICDNKNRTEIILHKSHIHS